MNENEDRTLMMHARIAPDLDSEHRRREPRLEVCAEVPLRELGASAADARLLNISSHGFMAETREPISAGARVWLTLPGSTRVNALIVWADGDRIGGEFAEAIDPLQVFQALGEDQL